MKELSLERMEVVVGGTPQSAFATGMMCTVTFFLLFSPFMPLVGATGPGCAVGIYGELNHG